MIMKVEHSITMKKWWNSRRKKNLGEWNRKWLAGFEGTKVLENITTRNQRKCIWSIWGIHRVNTFRTILIIIRLRCNKYDTYYEIHMHDTKFVTDNLTFVKNQYFIFQCMSNVIFMTKFTKFCSEVVYGSFPPNDNLSPFVKYHYWRILSC